jgi:exodeoxyribonuclease V alpha subunit
VLFGTLVSRGPLSEPGSRQEQLFGATAPGNDKVLQGVVERVAFTNPENGWSVVRIQPEGGRPVTAVGTLPGVQPGEELRLVGQWIVDKKYGRQFQIESFVLATPSTLRGIEKYLGSGMVPGIGKEMARRLVGHFGLETLDVIEVEPRRLSEVPGVGPKRTEQISKAWKEQRAIKDVMVFLQSHGVTPGLAVKIVKRYGDRAIPKVKAKPYDLAVDIPGIGFKTADAIAAQLGVSRTSPERAAAGLLHVLGEAADSGHVYCPREDLVRNAESILQIDTDVIENALLEVAEDGHVVVESVEDACSDAVYLTRLHDAEVDVAHRLQALLDAELKPLDIDTEAALRWFEGRHDLELASQQKEAVQAPGGGHRSDGPDDPSSTGVQPSHHGV